MYSAHRLKTLCLQSPDGLDIPRNIKQKKHGKLESNETAIKQQYVVGFCHDIFYEMAFWIKEQVDIILTLDQIM